MYKVKRGTVKVDGKDYVPGQPLPGMDQDDIESLLAEKLIEVIVGETEPLMNLGITMTEDSINSYAESLEDNAILKVAGDEQIESVIPETDTGEENFDEAAGDFSVDFNIDDYLAAEPEKEVEEKPKDEPEHKKAAHKKGGK